MTPAKVNSSNVSLFAALALITALLASPLLQASGLNLHWLWHNSCADCHGHSADFSRRFLSDNDGQLMGLHYQENIKLFLHNHYLAGTEVDAMYDMLHAQLITPPRFKNECNHCHANAVVFVQKSLLFDNGVLVGQKSKLAVKEFLQNHQGLNADDIEFYMQQLTRIAHEIYRP